MTSFDDILDFELDTPWDDDESSNDFPTCYSCTEQGADCCQSWDTENWRPWDHMNTEQFMEALCFKCTSIGCTCSPLEVALYTAEWKTRNAVCDAQYALQEIWYKHTPHSGKDYEEDLHSHWKGFFKDIVMSQLAFKSLVRSHA
jgi:hypothetical protein